ncbi:MAG: glycoside hydrolase family 3 C-terminal domain-containing protein, partial [Algicola sp.]|nr:glycoside hydrolase family 3 C-terminal domain-containing protein [Algicola sp.]
TLEQKGAQMIQPEIRDITVADMRKYGFGSYLNGGGSFPNSNKQATPADWIKLAEAMYQASVDDSLDGSAIPTLWGTDAVHGHNNVIGATLFPHNIGLGAANNPKLLEKIASITASEVMVTGIDWVFAPTVAVVRDDRWGRTYEGYSEDPQIVKAYAAAIVTGLQGAGDEFLSERRVIGTVKHFLGDGGTELGDDQGDNLDTEQRLFDIHAQGYVGGLTAGAQTVMASFNSWHGKKNHGNKYLLTDVLKTRMGFDGLVVGDWNGHGQVAGCSNESCPQSINAGMDVLMAPTSSWKPLYYNTIAEVKAGQISQARIDDAVRRILRVKMRAGLFTKPSPANRPLSGKTAMIGSDEHRAVARQAVRESLVLLKNNEQLLPLSPGQHILLAGDGADNIGKQSGGWTITWQGTGNANSDFPGGTSIYQGVKQSVEAAGGTTELNVEGEFKQKPDVAIVVFGEDPYAEGNGDLDNLEYQRGNKKDLALLKKLKAQGIRVVSVFISGRPMWVNAELNASDAFVAAWLPGSEGQGVADVLFTKPNGQVNHDFKGKLSFSWPTTPQQTTVNRFDDEYQPLLAYGFGLQYGQPSVLANNLSENSEGSANGLQALALFEGTVKKPWNLYISNQTSRQLITSSVQQNGIVHMRTIDKLVQEDARRVTFNGKGSGTVAISNDFPKDLRSYLEANASLSLMVKVDEAAAGPVMLAMADKQVDLTSTLMGLPANSWQAISVDLACFDKDNSVMGSVFSPFSLTTSAQFSISFADIAIRPNTAKNATVSCQ